MNLPDLVAFLQQKTCLGNLSAEILHAIADLLSELVVASNEIVIKENEQFNGLYIIQSGKVESDSKLNTLQSSLLSGTVLNLYALLLNIAFLTLVRYKIYSNSELRILNT